MKYITLPFDFSEESADRFQQLMQLVETKHGSRVLRNALRVYEYLVNKTEKEDFEIRLRKGNGIINIGPLPMGD